MLRWALIFFIISIITGYFGYGRASAATGNIAKILFFIFIAITVVWIIVAFAIGQAIF